MIELATEIRSENLCNSLAVANGISRLHEELRFLEDELEAGAPVQDATSALARLNQLEQQANDLRLPTTYASMQYVLRHHIALVRERLTTHRDQPAPSVVFLPRNQGG